MTRVPNRSLRAVVLAGVLLCAFAGPASTASAAPCWKSLLTDWYDGTIDKTYPIPCYQQAVEHLPTDAELYSSAREDILQALQQTIAAKNPPTTAATTTTAPPTTTGSSSVPPVTTTTPPTTTTATTPTTTSPGRPKKKGFAGAIDKLNPGAADSFPLPLLILGGLAILLVAAGVAGMVWRRFQSDRPSTP